jgi:outer membrane receptor protein involved in Fe transport
MLRGRIRDDAGFVGMSLVSMMLFGSSSALAQEEGAENGLEEVIVTAQKRVENLQNVPMSVQALNTARLEELNIGSFNDYVKFLPSVTFQTAGPGFSQISIRGVSSGASDHSGPMSTVATYLDEQPVTTNQGTLDIHIYDVARVEALAGPQGTLYGASSQAGTLRIITNKPDPGRFEAAYDLEGNLVSGGDAGYVAEGYVNAPLSPTTAIRLVGWSKRDAGYLDNVAGTRVFPTSGACIANTNPPPPGCSTGTNLAQKNFNNVDTSGARAALRIDLDEQWTITPAIMAQETRSSGYSGSGYDPELGDLKTTHFYRNYARDRWINGVLTVEGQISNFDLVYNASLLKRDETMNADYSDYSLAYDQYLSPIITNDAGVPINPSQLTTNEWEYEKQSHELRISQPKTGRLGWVAGLFMQRQEHDIENRYQIQDLARSLWISGWPTTWWLTKQLRVDRDYAVFGELSYDLTTNLTATGGLRFFKARNTLAGFYGLSQGVADIAGIVTGEAACFAPGRNGAPCTNLDKEVEESGHTPKLNLTYRFDDERMIYATWAQGFRPGGVNRNGTAPPYKSDLLSSYEIGWKTSWAGHRVRFNGALFVEDWDDFQFTFTGPNGVAVFANAGQARIEGIESSIEWAVKPDLLISGGVAVMDPKLTENYCGLLDANGNAVTNCAAPLAPKGTQLPGSSKLKGNIAIRYSFAIADAEAHVQGAYVYQSGTWPDLRMVEREILGRQASYGLADFSAGLQRGDYSFELFVSNAFDERAQLTRYSKCAPTACGSVGTYMLVSQPRTLGLRFGQKF